MMRLAHAAILPAKWTRWKTRKTYPQYGERKNSASSRDQKPHTQGDSFKKSEVLKSLYKEHWGKMLAKAVS